MRVGVALIHYHTPHLAQRALDAVLADAKASQLDVEAVVVDNGSTKGDRTLLEQLPARVLRPRQNLGYAGGINLGVRELNQADAYVVMNPDVIIEPGCLGALCCALEDGAAVAGPSFFWDQPGGFQLPPLEPCHRRYEWLRWRATRSSHGAAALRRAWRRHAQQHWQATANLASHSLSGALLAIAADAWRHIGPFDDGFQLYFEETEWLQRARQLGFAGRYVPTAHAVHLYAQSTPNEPRTRGWFEASEERFRRLRYGTAFSTLLRRLGQLRPPTPHTGDISTLAAGEPWPAAPEARWLEVSPSPLGIPAAARRLTAGLSGEEPALPSELWQRMSPGDYFLRTVDERGEESEPRLLRRSPDE